MSIYTEEQKRKWIQPVESIATKMYKKQLSDISWIAHMDWYKEIKRYWETVRDTADDKLKIATIDNLAIIQLEYRIAFDFIRYLENIEEAIVKET